MVDIFKMGEGSIEKKNNILQLSDAPDIVITGKGDKYIGYEYIGDAYSGNQKYLIEEHDAVLADYIADATGDGIFLDLACGDGCITVPCAKHRTKIIAGDISNTMMTILQERAKHNDISLDNVTLCRMNALDIPIKDESVDCVIANSVLHLISNPQRVLDEIFRVLKPGGSFICVDDAPGTTPELGEEYAKENEEYMQVLNGIYSTYWAVLNSQGIFAKKYSWRFDRDSACKVMFSSFETKQISFGSLYFKRLEDTFLPRFIGCGFSDQVDVPTELHQLVCQKVIADFRKKYGERFDAIGYHGVENDMIITEYVK